MPQNQQGQNQGVTPVDPNEPQLDDANSIEEGKKAKEDYLVWKNYLMLQDKYARIKVNYDSLYNIYTYQRSLLMEEGSKFNTVIIPNQVLPKLIVMDTLNASHFTPMNKFFSVLHIGKKNMSDLTSAQIKSIQNADNGYKIKTFDLISEVLPPILLNETPLTEKQYEKIIKLFFTNTPSLIYYCSNDFIYLFSTNQFNKIMALQIASKNKIEIIKTNIK